MGGGLWEKKAYDMREERRSSHCRTWEGSRSGLNGKSRRRELGR
jgi:hypothetical protein